MTVLLGHRIGNTFVRSTLAMARVRQSPKSWLQHRSIPGEMYEQAAASQSGRKTCSAMRKPQKYLVLTSTSGVTIQ
ncbi:hypothetical protein N7530_012611 [Penicillium desertorum]|uniref:Uncharacterized protein n=1 Tax=Penicillium desertorum TaxID=1303715 RepID=A0A9W9WFU6_9EURO|nr:hypothetical protein N7530_012611 [Penicillium desertorum]